MSARRARRESTAYHSFANTDQPIERRIIDALIYIIHTRKQQPKAIYLTAADMEQLPLRNRSSINGIPVRLGKNSMFYYAGWYGRKI